MRCDWGQRYSRQSQRQQMHRLRFSSNCDFNSIRKCNCNSIAIQFSFPLGQPPSLPPTELRETRKWFCLPLLATLHSPLTTHHSPLSTHHLPSDKLCTSYFDVTFLQLLYIFRWPVNPKSFSLCFEVDVLVKLWWWWWCCDLTIVYSVDVVGFLCNLWLDCHN